MTNQVTFGQFKNSFDTFKRFVDYVDEKDFNVLWMDDYYDGMLNGMLEYKDSKFKFEIITDYTLDVRPRVFAIINLTQSQFEEEAHWNELFKKYVGNHNNFDSYEPLNQKQQELHHIFYDDYNRRETPNYEFNTVRGWFTQ